MLLLTEDETINKNYNYINIKITLQRNKLLSKR